MTKTQKKLWIGLVIMALLSPLGIILPAIFNAGGAWGEWSAEQLEKLLGFVPEGLRKDSDLWKAPVQDYNLGGEAAPDGVQLVSYIISGAVGIIVVALIVYLISKMVVKDEK
ncbi:MAG: cobalamin biosynthesis protein [Nitrospirota bacterium]|nr:MAG: cobalamin biosynthesis protein [Nitrospirota bacterium]